MDTHQLQEKLLAIGVAEGGEMFLGKPDRWYKEPLWRCVNNHVSLNYLKSEQCGRALCLECFEPVMLTFPEDKEGPLVEPVAAAQPQGGKEGA